MGRYNLSGTLAAVSGKIGGPYDAVCLAQVPGGGGAISIGWR